MRGRGAAASRLVRLVVASGTATAVDTAVLFGLCRVGGLGPGLAAFVGCVAGGAVNFAINRRWVFSGGARSWLVQAASYGLVVVGGGAVVTGVAVAAGVGLGLPLGVAKAGATVLALVTWTYPMSARVVFAPSPSARALA